jgi:hypothetical protein
VNDEPSGGARVVTIGSVASEFIRSELALERARKDLLPERAMRVITTCGALVTLLLALSAFITQADEFVLPHLSQWLLSGAAAMFVVAAVLAIAASRPSMYLQLDPASLQTLVAERTWEAPGIRAAREVTVAQLVELSDTRARNQRRARLIAVALGIEVLGVLLTACFVVYTIMVP